jgi:hypothetical protein
VVLDLWLGGKYLREYPGNRIDINLGLLNVQLVRWDKGGTLRPAGYIFSMEKETKSIN